MLVISATQCTFTSHLLYSRYFFLVFVLNIAWPQACQQTTTPTSGFTDGPGTMTWMFLSYKPHYSDVWRSIHVLISFSARPPFACCVAEHNIDLLCSIWNISLITVITVIFYNWLIIHWSRTLVNRSLNCDNLIAHGWHCYIYNRKGIIVVLGDDDVVVFLSMTTCWTTTKHMLLPADPCFRPQETNKSSQSPRQTESLVLISD